MTAVFPQDANHGTGHIGCAFRWHFVYQIQLTFTLHQANIADTAIVFNGTLDVRYDFFVQATDNAGNVEPFKNASETGVTVGVEDNTLAGLPEKYQLMQNYPNPFNPTTTIRYALPQTSDVEVIIFNVLGQKVRSLVNQKQEAGYQQVVWDGRNESRLRVSSGIYFYRLKAGTYVKSKKMMVLK